MQFWPIIFLELTFYLGIFEGLVGVDADINAVRHETKFPHVFHTHGSLDIRDRGRI